MSAIPENNREARLLFRVISELEPRLGIHAIPVVRANFLPLDFRFTNNWEIVDPERYYLFIHPCPRRTSQITLVLFELTEPRCARGEITAIDFEDEVDQRAGLRQIIPYESRLRSHWIVGELSVAQWAQQISKYIKAVFP